MAIDFSNAQVAAATVAGLVAVTVGLLTVLASWLVAERKFRADRALALSEKAWADYELRRDVYLEVAHQVDCLFETGDPKGRPDFHRTARKVRVVGSDEVVKALNGLTSGIRDGHPMDILEQQYRLLFNAMRQDIRQLHVSAPKGTGLGPEAFPIEG